LEEPAAFAFRVEELSRMGRTVYNIGKEGLELRLWAN
jgi:hypothetical protein